MASDKRNAGAARPVRFKNPMVLMVNLVLVSIVILFIGITYGYLAKLGSSWLVFRLPKIFWLSTLSILLVSFLLQRLMAAYDADHAHEMKIRLGLAFGAAMLFSVCQVIGWQELIAQGLMMQAHPSVAYLYILTGLHIAHVAVGLIFFIVAAFRLQKNTATKVSALLYFADPLRRDRLKLLVHYWHTIDFVWVMLFLSFLYNHT